VEPIGTITVHLPYVDDTTRDTIQTVMHEAIGFDEFIEMLCERVIKESSPPLLEFFTAYFAYHSSNYIVINKLKAAGKVTDLGLPLTMLIKHRSQSPLDNGDPLEWEQSRKSLIQALSSAPNDWIASLVYVAWRLVAEEKFPECDIDIQSLDTISSTVDEKPEFSYFKTYLHLFQAQSYSRENKRDDFLRELKKALANARKMDDILFVSTIMTNIAGLVKHKDVKQAIDLLISSKEMSEKVGYKMGIAFVQHQLGHIMGFRGELDAAIDYHIEYREIRETLGIRHETMNPIIAFFYNQYGNGRKAYPLAKTIVRLEGSPSRAFAYSYAQLAWALVNLGRVEEAKSELATAHSYAVKSGDSDQIAWVTLVEGVLEKTEKNYEGATTTLKELLKYHESSPIPVIKNICLINLTEIETDTLTEEVLRERTDSSGPWMNTLFEYAEENGFPGITARAFLLKAKLRQRQGQYEEVRKILKEVQKTAESPSMRYLNEVAISMFPDIIVS
jgi:tetratricopeptide (TPR) repeat protein